MIAVAVGATAVVWYEGRLLIGRKGQRSSLDPRSTFEGKWVTPGGRVRFGESYLDAALRECYEETGVELWHPTVLRPYEVILPGAHFVIVAVTAVPTGNLRRPAAADDLEDVRWADRDELIKLWSDMTEITRDIVTESWGKHP
jgi:ADP-ribose pyrophosphatase YjhB (NUDIX family)